MTFLGELNRDIVDTHKSLADLNETMAMTLQDSKKWNIVSRLLSGTGLWAVQNRLRALISIVGEYNRATIQQLEDAQKSAELLDKLGSRTENLAKATENFNTARRNTPSDLEDKEKELLAAQQLAEVRANAPKILQKTKVKRMEILEQANKDLSEHRQTSPTHYGGYKELHIKVPNPIKGQAIVGGIGNPFGAFLGGYVIAFAEILITYAYKKFFIIKFIINRIHIYLYPPPAFLYALANICAFLALHCPGFPPFDPAFIL